MYDLIGINLQSKYLWYKVFTVCNLHRIYRVNAYNIDQQI